MKKPLPTNKFTLCVNLIGLKACLMWSPYGAFLWCVTCLIVCSVWMECLGGSVWSWWTQVKVEIVRVGMTLSAPMTCDRDYIRCMVVCMSMYVMCMECSSRIWSGHKLVGARQQQFVMISEPLITLLDPGRGARPNHQMARPVERIPAILGVFWSVARLKSKPLDQGLLLLDRLSEGPECTLFSCAINYTELFYYKLLPNHLYMTSSINRSPNTHSTSILTLAKHKPLSLLFSLLQV